MYQELFMMVVQTLAGSTSQRYSNHSLTYNKRHGVLCLVRVYALYGRSRRILALLLFLGSGSIFTALVCRFYPTLIMHVFFKLSIKVSLNFIRNTGDESIDVVSTFGGCTLFTPYIGYVVDPACVAVILFFGTCV